MICCCLIWSFTDLEDEKSIGCNQANCFHYTIHLIRRCANDFLFLCLNKNKQKSEIGMVTLIHASVLYAVLCYIYNIYRVVRSKCLQLNEM